MANETDDTIQTVIMLLLGLRLDLLEAQTMTEADARVLELVGEAIDKLHQATATEKPWPSEDQLN